MIIRAEGSACDKLFSLLNYLKPATLVLALGLAIAGIEAGWGHFFEWKALGENYKAYYALKLFFSLVLLGIVTFAFWERKYAGLHLLAIAGAALTLAATQFIALATQSVLCSSPG